MTYNNAMKRGEAMKDRIKKIRKSLNLTQREFAEKIGTSQNVLANYEIGRRNPSASVVNNICKTYNVSEEWLKTGTGEMFQPATRYTEIAKLTKTLLNEEEDSFKNRVISVLANLTEEQWGLLADIAEKIAKEKD